MTRSFVRLSVVALLASLSAPAFAEVRDGAARTPASDFVLKDSTGHQVKLSGLKGKVILLDFWATWCTGCKVEIPWYVEFQKKYKRKGLSAVGVSMDEEGWARVRPYLAEHPISYPIVIGTDPLMKAFTTVAALPVTLLIDRRGRVAAVHEGLVDKDVFERDIQQLIEERPR